MAQTEFGMVIFSGYQPELPQQKKALQGLLAGHKGWHRPTLPRTTAVPSALEGLTALFGMGRGGPLRYGHLLLMRSGCWALGPCPY